MQQAENNINNYKGVMLCSRPNQNKHSDFEKPFCARVVPNDALGLTPFQRASQDVHPIKKKTNPILMKHKKWLQSFSDKQKLKKQMEQHERWEKEEQFNKVREQAQKNRQETRNMKKEFNALSEGVMNVLDDEPKKEQESRQSSKRVVGLNPDNLKKLNDVNDKQQSKKQAFKKKKEKPAWAYSEEQYKKKQEDQEEELLNFFETTDIDEYVNNIEVTAVLKVLKEKIESIKKEENWKQKQLKKIKQREDDDAKSDDARSVGSNSIESQGSKSVASEKSSKRIQQLQKQKEAKQEWDNVSKSSKSHANYEEKIAKNMADEVLRNYGNFKGVHSNTSVRKLLEREAMKEIGKVEYPTISTVQNASVPLNVSNLPYLHRNPSI